MAGSDTLDVEGFAVSFASSSIGEALSELFPELASSTTVLSSSSSSSLSQLPSNSDAADESGDDIVSRVMKRFLYNCNGSLKYNIE